jgi:hypothetical protein
VARVCASVLVFFDVGLATLKVLDVWVLIGLMIRRRTPEVEPLAFKLFKEHLHADGRFASFARYAADRGFRAPSVVLMSLATLEIVHVLSPHSNHVLGAIAGCLTAIVGVDIVAAALVAIILERMTGGDPYGAAGFHDKRSDMEERRVDSALDPIVVIIVTTLTVALGYAVAYRFLSLADAHAIYTAGKPTRLGLIVAVYFSATIAGTVGFGDYVPHSQLTMCVFISQAFVTIIALGLLISYLGTDPRVGRRRRVNPREVVREDSETEELHGQRAEPR